MLRLYNLNFGLPHSFYADEPEFTEPAIKYTYQLRDIVTNNNYYQIIPISYVYGTLPVYTLTTALIIFSKVMHLAGISNFDKYTVFVFFRVLMVLVSMGIVFITTLLARKLEKHKESNANWASIFTLFLIAFNYKFIVHAHYVNADAILTLLLMCSFYAAWKYYQNPSNKTLLIMALFFGLAVGTKITALISLPLFLYLILKKKDIYGIAGFIFTTLLAYIISNPFSIIFFNDFSFRIFSMLSKEGGIVFDSVDYKPLKYLFALNAMATIPVMIIFLIGIYSRLKNKSEKTFDIFLLANFVFYFLFFSAQSRRVDRWLLPVLPIVLIYASFGLNKLIGIFDKKIYKSLLLIIVFGIYLYFPILLLTQFSRWTPKSAAYIWADKNLPEFSSKLVYTEEGLDPMNKLGMVKVKQFNVYVSEGAQLDYPEDPFKYDYIILSSRPMENFKRAEVIRAFPNYSKAWLSFEMNVQDPQKFQLIKEFSITKPNLIPLSDVFIYKRL